MKPLYYKQMSLLRYTMSKTRTVANPFTRSPTLLEITTAPNDLPVCYICFDLCFSKSPCKCNALCHIEPCLLQSIRVNRNSACTICKDRFVHEKIDRLLLEIAHSDALDCHHLNFAAISMWCCLTILCIVLTLLVHLCLQRAAVKLF
jgi:hypothetical protein